MDVTGAHHFWISQSSEFISGFILNLQQTSITLMRPSEHSKSICQRVPSLLTSGSVLSTSYQLPGAPLMILYVCASLSGLCWAPEKMCNCGVKGVHCQ